MLQETEATSPLSAEIDTEECGISKGCYRHPKGCPEKYCSLIVTWVDKGEKVLFEIGGDTEGWVALGFSRDKKMVRAAFF